MQREREAHLRGIMIPFIAGVLMVPMLLTALGGCGAGEDTNKLPETEHSGSEDDRYEEYIPQTVGIYEAEDAEFSGNVKDSKSKKSYSGKGYAEGFQEDGDACIFTVEIPYDGFYDLNFISASSGGEKHNYVMVDDERIGTVRVDESSFSDSILARVYFTAGTHTVSYSKYWGWIYLDNLTITVSKPIDSAVYEVSAKLCNENASESARRLMSYLCDIYGTYILSGQNCDTGMYGKEFQVINNTTGKTPAVLGLDFMEYSPSRVENGSLGYATEHAVNFWEKGGIVTFCWHWNAPAKYLTGKWYSGFYVEHTNIDLEAIMSGRDEEGYELLLADMDAIAKQLQILQEADVPVLFRPLHEASGGWFWWGAYGADAYKKLYILLYEKLTYEYELNNLIWVWNGQSRDWYPGDEYVDIVGEDIYPGEKVYASQISKYLEVVSYADSVKPVCMTENGCIFDPGLAIRDGAMWGMWCTWSGEFICKDTAISTLSEQYTEKEMLIKAYTHENVITLEDLPDLKNYSLRDEAR